MDDFPVLIVGAGITLLGTFVTWIFSVMTNRTILSVRQSLELELNKRDTELARLTDLINNAVQELSDLKTQAESISDALHKLERLSDQHKIYIKRLVTDEERNRAAIDKLNFSLVTINAAIATLNQSTAVHKQG